MGILELRAGALPAVTCFIWSHSGQWHSFHR